MLVFSQHLGILRPPNTAEKSTLWTDTGVDQNFQRDLGAIGPYKFQRKFVWTNGDESSSKVSPETGIGPWMALPNTATQGKTENDKSILFYP